MFSIKFKSCVNFGTPFINRWAWNQWNLPSRFPRLLMIERSIYNTPSLVLDGKIGSSVWLPETEEYTNERFYYVIRPKHAYLCLISLKVC